MGDTLSQDLTPTTPPPEPSWWLLVAPGGPWWLLMSPGVPGGSLGDSVGSLWCMVAPGGVRMRVSVCIRKGVCLHVHVWACLFHVQA